jgi:uncharacterized protein involved in tolerance to divalent cations
VFKNCIRLATVTMTAFAAVVVIMMNVHSIKWREKIYFNKEYILSLKIIKEYSETEFLLQN